ncbi:sensor histidine kinase [Leptospira idonii]|nr:ATP-binding protein [Leptospira idonii]
MNSLTYVLSHFSYLNYVALDQEKRIRALGGEDLSDWGVRPEEHLGQPKEKLSVLKSRGISEKIRKAYSGETYEREIQIKNQTFHLKFFPFENKEKGERWAVLTVCKRKEITCKPIVQTQTQNNVIRYEEQLFREIREIFDWREEIKSKTKQSLWMDRALPNLNTSLMQGSGLGALISTINSLLRRADVQEEKVVISLSHLNLLKESYHSTKKLVSTLAKAQRILEDSIASLETVSLQELYDMVVSATEELSAMLQIKNQKIILSSIPSTKSFSLEIHKEAMRTVVREIFINAMKYTPSFQDIIVLFIPVQGKIAVKFINPSSYPEVEHLNFLHSEEEILFQPFFRLIKAVEEGYEMEEFGLGLGLPIVKKLVEDMKGEVYMNLVKTNITDENRLEVCFTIELPMKG